MEWFDLAYRQWSDRHRKFIASHCAYFEGKTEVATSFATLRCGTSLYMASINCMLFSHSFVFLNEILNTFHSDIKIYTHEFSDESNDYC